MRLFTVVVAVSASTTLLACGGGIVTTAGEDPPPAAQGSTLTTFYSSVKLDGSQCLPQALDRMCRVLVVNSRCVGEEGLREAEPSDEEGVAALTTIGAGQRVCELAQMSPGLCRTKKTAAWCYVAGDCELSASSGPSCAHALCPGMGMGPTLAALGAAYLACDR